MTHTKPVASLMAVMALLVLCSTSAFAETSTKMTLLSTLSVNGTELKAGQYKVSWEEHSPDVTVTFSRGKKEVATAHGKIMDRGVKYRRNMVVYEGSSDGPRTLVEIQLGGTSHAIVFK
jgi:uncharacterized protein YlzI (FlbEa/FlbD family)